MRTSRRRIKSEVDNGRPVLAFGVISPPECCLITGYDDDGRFLWLELLSGRSGLRRRSRVRA